MDRERRGEREREREGERERERMDCAERKRTEGEKARKERKGRIARNFQPRHFVALSKASLQMLPATTAIYSYILVSSICSCSASAHATRT